jgi:hypothetical protein
MRWISTTENILVEDCFQRKMTTTWIILSFYTLDVCNLC